MHFDKYSTYHPRAVLLLTHAIRHMLWHIFLPVAYILPLMDVSFGVGAGAFSGEKKDNGGGGMAGKMTPCAVLVIQNGTTKLVNVKNQDGLTKILDMVPDFVDRFTSGKGDEESVGESEK